MLVMIERRVPGCAYQPGTTLKISEKQARKLVRLGVGRILSEDEEAVVGPPRRREGSVNKRIRHRSTPPRRNPAQHSKPRGDTHMDPPRHICACGLVNDSQAALDEHREGCEICS